jgi:hypothetical protein
MSTLENDTLVGRQLSQIPDLLSQAITCVLPLGLRPELLYQCLLRQSSGFR